MCKVAKFHSKIRADPKKLKAITELSFPRSKKGMQSYNGVAAALVHGAEDLVIVGDSVSLESARVDFTLSIRAAASFISKESASSLHC
ncbi:hypothetical protein PF008_g25172 [Phytophthora fragariae]|uniref:Uncharacterized protein n=1 Tax=Phytophthora fragariae TaxID=53985 RepID=A0A6G0QKQ8_9STRA|nr:hypothetical protein PF008_g25172 [Phytophthora fragariae]